MVNLNCGVTNCIHNNNSFCCETAIKVGRHHATDAAGTCCHNFEKKSEEFTSVVESPKAQLQITCEAKNCAHNSNRYCCAQHVDVAGRLEADECEDTMCSTFESR